MTFYNFQISTLNKSANSFRKADFGLREVGQILKTVKYLETVVKHFEALCSGFYLGEQQLIDNVCQKLVI